MSTRLYISEPEVDSFKAFVKAASGDYQFRFAPFNGSAVNFTMRPVDDNQASSECYFKAPPSSLSFEEYNTLLHSTINAIKEHGWGKVVIARTQIFDKTIDAWQVFNHLVKWYPSACVYLFTSPQTGTWLGATPEVLLSAKNQRLQTMSLAGTQRIGEEDNFTQKEEEEQKLVTDYIAAVLKQTRGVEKVQVSDKERAIAGNVVHFKTRFSAQTSRSFNAEELLKKMHPTPAVAGFPKKEALDFIAQHENLERSFYSGYFGLRRGADFNYYVNLRCAQIFENSYALYAGGGITKDSDPKAEYLETEAKMQTLQTVIGELETN